MTKLLSVEYVAGLFDGEGCVSILKHKHRRFTKGYTIELIVQFGMTNEEIILRLKKQFKGTTKISRRKPHQNWKDCYRLTIYCIQALKFLEAIQPFVIVKSEQVNLGIEFQKSKIKGKHTTKQEADFQEYCWDKMRCLNKRGRK
jgi:hypothetical protein